MRARPYGTAAEVAHAVCRLEQLSKHVGPEPLAPPQHPIHLLAEDKTEGALKWTNVTIVSGLIFSLNQKHILYCFQINQDSEHVINQVRHLANHRSESSGC